VTVRMYRSTDTSAPTLSGSVGDLVNLLDKCLVAGYGSQTAAGWSKPYTGTNKAAFQQGAGSGLLFRCLDDGSLTAGAREATFRGFETMSDVDTGTNAFPTTGQLAGGILLRKSDTADATTRQWIVLADARTAYVFVNSGASTAYIAAIMLGDIKSVLPNDAYCAMLIGRVTSAAIDTITNETLDTDQLGAGSSTWSAAAGHYIVRGYSLVAGSVQTGVTSSMTPGVNSVSAAFGSVGMAPFPNPPDGAGYLGQLWVTDPTTTPVSNMRGYLRGCYTFFHLGNLCPGNAIYVGVDALAGRTFMMLAPRTGRNANSMYLMEISDTWD
jgi:hypothetical protein